MKQLGTAKGVYPYNTGKVNIGAMYIPQRHQYTTQAELWTQDLLLRSKKRGTCPPTSVTLFAGRLRSLVQALTFWRK